MTEYLKELGPQLVVVEATGGLEGGGGGDGGGGIAGGGGQPEKGAGLCLAKTALDAQALAHYGETLRPHRGRCPTPRPGN